MVENCTTLEHSIWDGVASALSDFGADVWDNVEDVLWDYIAPVAAGLVCVAGVGNAIAAVTTPATAAAITANPYYQAGVGVACGVAAATVTDYLRN